jgi:hypothetical protein
MAQCSNAHLCMIFEGCLDSKQDSTSRCATNLATNPSSLIAIARPVQSGVVQSVQSDPFQWVQSNQVQFSPMVRSSPAQTRPSPGPFQSCLFQFFLQSNLVFSVQPGLSSSIHSSPGQSSPIQSSHPVLPIKPSPVKPVSPAMPSPGAFQSFLARPTP